VLLLKCIIKIPLNIGMERVSQNFLPDFLSIFGWTPLREPGQNYELDMADHRGYF